MISIAALMGKGILDSSLAYHIKNAKNNGLTKKEFVEIVTQIAFYTGWPNAWAVFKMEKEVYTEKCDNCMLKVLEKCDFMLLMWKIGNISW